MQKHQRLSLELLQWAGLCVSPCTLPAKFTEGGSGKAFILAALDLYHNNKALRVVGAPYCSSACAVMVDKLKAIGGDVCIQNGMRMRFHRVSPLEQDPNGSLQEEDTTPTIAMREVRAWVDSRGGIPADGSWIIIPDSLVAAQYRYCS